MSTNWSQATLRRHRRRRGPALGGGRTHRGGMSRGRMLRVGLGDERGATLIIALAFLLFFSLLGTMVMGYAYSQMGFSKSAKNQANQYYNTDGALDAAINMVRNDPLYGVDPTYQTNPAYAPGQSKDCVLQVPGQNGAPNVTVSCAAVPVDPSVPGQVPSGKQNQTGTAPKAAITTLGEARDYYGQIPQLNFSFNNVDYHQPRASECPGNDSSEVGIRGQQFTSTFLGSCFLTQNPPKPVGPLGTIKVQGSIGANSPIWFNGTSNVAGQTPTLQLVAPPDGSTPIAVVRSKSGEAPCSASAVTGAAGCTQWAYGAPDPSGGTDPNGGTYTELTRDPYYQSRSTGCATCGPPPGSASTFCQTNPCNHYPQNFVTDPATGQSTPSAQPADESYNSGTDPYPSYRFLNWNSPAIPTYTPTTCPSGAIKLYPGVYTNLTALNSLFATCDQAYWFQPGVYYFNFNAAPTTTHCDPSGTSRNEWCVPGRNTWVVGGTPYGWDPNATSGTSSTSILTLTGASNVVPVLGGLFGLEWNGNTPTAAANIDGNYAQGSPSAFGLSNVQLTGYPVVQAGNYGGNVNVKVTHYETGPQNAPQIQVGYNGYNTTFGPVASQVCGTYTLTQSGSAHQDQLSAAQQTQLGSCLSTGDKLSRVYVNYITSASLLDAWFGGPKDYLDGAEIDVAQIVNQPKVPDPAVPTTGDPGGNCDPNQPGVQFLFGGESHLVMSAAAGGAGAGTGYSSLELCAGPDIGLQKDSGGTAIPLNDKPQIAVFGVPGVPILTPSSVAPDPSKSTGTPDIDNRSNAMGLGEPSGQIWATLNDPFCFFCNSSTGLKFNYPAYTPPTGYTVDSASLIVGYNTSPSAPFNFAGDQPHYFVNGGCDSGGLNNAGGGNGPQSIQIQVFDITRCLGSNAAQVTGALASGFNATWQDWCYCTLGSQPAYVDGAVIALHVVPINQNISPTDPTSHYLTPATGCRTLLPNYWNGQGTGWDGGATSITPNSSTSGGNDCALIRTGVPGNSNQQGRLSVKGTTYAPSDAIDISEWENQYSVFNRGLIARHLTIRNYYPCAGPGDGPPPSKPAICTAAATDPFAMSTLDHTTAPRNVQFVACIKASGATGACDPNTDKILGTAAVLFKGTSKNPIGPNQNYTNLLQKVAENTPVVENWNIRY